MNNETIASELVRVAEGFMAGWGGGTTTFKEMKEALGITSRLLSKIKDDLKKIQKGGTVENLTEVGAKQVIKGLEEAIKNQKKLLSITQAADRDVDTVKVAGVADTIAKQMGGLNRLRAMLGAHSFATGGNDFSFVFPNKQRSKGNAVQITLTGDDLYTMDFYNVSVKGRKKVASFNGLFWDQLVEVFEKQTGWFLKL